MCIGLFVCLIYIFVGFSPYWGKKCGYYWGKMTFLTDGYFFFPLIWVFCVYYMGKN